MRAILVQVRDVKTPQNRTLSGCLKIPPSITQLLI